MTQSNLTRRGALAGGMAAAVGAGFARPARAQSTPKTFVLVHGAACGGWIWRRVADLLEKQGCKVFAPTFTGLGERSHLLTKVVGLDTHVTDVVNVVKWESLDGFCLVAHSYAGWPCGAALDAIGDKVASVVWLDAFKPEDGRRLIDLVAEPMRKTIDSAAAKGELGIPTPTRLPPTFVNPRDAAFVESKLTPQPIATYTQPIDAAGGLEQVAKKTYVRLPIFANPVFDKALAACRADPSWSTIELADCGHLAMLDAPERVADLLLRAA
jgi:pimeloyl-ACP methyl ester carboxylesterase